MIAWFAVAVSFGKGVNRCFGQDWQNISSTDGFVEFTLVHPNPKTLGAIVDLNSLTVRHDEVHFRARRTF
jgi:hypothetical protein